MTASAIYESVVRHRRFRPKQHRLRYRVYSLLLDLDELESVERRIPIFSHNRWNLVSFHDRDHGPRDGTDLRGWFRNLVAGEGVDLDGGTIRVLAFPRIFGYTFNPLTVWFGSDRRGELRAILYEIHNTFGHSHSHLVLLPGDERVERTSMHTFDKTLHVSPFFDQSGRYRVAVDPPSAQYRLVIEYLDDDGGRLLTASQQGHRVELTTASLLRQFITKPLLTIKIIGGIHWEALKLWRKGLQYHAVPEPPAVSISRTVEGAVAS